MSYHIVLSKETNLEEASLLAKQGTCPKHSMAQLSEVLNAKVHNTKDVKPNFLDQIIGLLSRTNPTWWAIARSLQKQVNKGDVIFCTGEDIGFPIALYCGKNCAVTIMAHRLDSVKKIIPFKIFNLKKKVRLFFTVSTIQRNYALKNFQPDPTKVKFLFDQTDTNFFSPEPTQNIKTRPLIVSVGLEKRDYITLAQATKDLEVDVKISGYSSDTRVIKNAFPENMPSNMTRNFYSWNELQNLYREADIIVVSLHSNRYAAGVQGLMEGLASGKPVIITRTDGLIDYLKEEDGMRVVQTKNPGLLKQSIEELLSNKNYRDVLGKSARARALQKHSCDLYVKEIARALKSI
jgi:glycosyltransferase involved in cell wall biosynthesis